MRGDDKQNEATRQERGRHNQLGRAIMHGIDHRIIFIIIIIISARLTSQIGRARTPHYGILRTVTLAHTPSSIGPP